MAGKKYNKFFEHDDRNFPVKERQNNSYRNKGKGGNYRGPGRYRNQDGDINMEPRNHIRRHKLYKNHGTGGRGGGGGGRVPSHMLQRRDFTTGFKRINVKNVEGLDENEILTELRRQVEKDFTPIVPSMDTHVFRFYLEDADIANALVNLSNRISIRHSRKLAIQAFDATPPYSSLSEPQIEIVKKVMSDRFSVEMNRLDLKNFHNDPTLIHSRIYCPLFMNAGLSIVMDIISKNIPSVIDIDLSNNRIAHAGKLIMLKNTKVERLNLESNNIRNYGQIRELQDLPILELNLNGNPICKSFKSEEVYSSSMRKLFPRLRLLDTIELQKPIGFELDENLKLPPNQPSFYCNENAKAIVIEFVKQYYSIFQTENRRMLEPAYTEDAYFSLINFVNDHMMGKHYSNKLFSEYNRNFMKINTEKKMKTLIQGRKAIVDILCSMPECLYDPSSFVIDVLIATPELMHVCLRGVFQISSAHEKLLRSFTRSLVIVPVGGGYCISNEEFSMHPATAEQKEKAFSNSTNNELSQSPQVVPTTGDAPVVTNPQNILNGLQPLQIEMIQKFHLDSKMKVEYCKECLERNDWNFEKAANMFVTLKNENKIPMEYF